MVYNGKLMLKQCEHYKNTEKRYIIAKEMEKGLQNNLIWFIKTFLYVKEHSNILKDIKRISRYNFDEYSISTIMGEEGAMMHNLYKAFKKYYSPDSWLFDEKTKTDPKKPSTLLFSLGNSILVSKVLSLLKIHSRVKPDLGFIHEPKAKKTPLAEDIAIVYRPIVIHQAIWKSIQYGIIKPEYFHVPNTCNEEYLIMNDGAIGRFRKVIEECLLLKYPENRVKSHSYTPKITVKRIIFNEIYSLQKHIRDQKRYQSYKMNHGLTINLV